jgi:ribosomal protein S18 acetylase RimI-like enzyme
MARKPLQQDFFDKEENPMTMRPLAMPGDLEPLESLLFESFQYPENPEWGVQEDERENLTSQIGTLRRLWPLLRAITWVYPRLRDMFGGYVWEEDGKPVGVVMVEPTGLMGGPAWTVGTVAVLPGYRRRGIARQLVEAAVALARERGAKTLMLDVIAQNKPAYELYKSLGFAHFATGFELVREPEGPLPAAEPLPEGYRARELSRAEWQPRYELARRVIPEDVQVFRPVEESDYHPPLLVRALMRLTDRLSGSTRQSYALHRETGGAVAEGVGGDGEPVAVARCIIRTKAGGINNVSLMLDPAHAELAPYLVSMITCKVNERSPGRRMRAGQFDWGQAVIDAALEMGFTVRREGHEMGLVLDEMGLVLD